MLHLTVHIDHCSGQGSVESIYLVKSPVTEDQLGLKLDRYQSYTRAHHRDEKPERDLTYHLTCLLIYHGTTTHLSFVTIF